MCTIFVICILGLVSTIDAEMDGFIVGGEFASINRYPHSAFLTVFCIPDDPANKTNWICGSAIVNQRILITAGHCVYPCSVGTSITVNLGHANRYSGTIRSASSFMLHERYNPLNSACDIALLKMMRPVQLNPRISRVALMKRPPYNERARLAGWGLYSEENKTPGINLKSLQQKVWRHASCQYMFGGLPRGTICASSKIQNDFATQGDSGSGLIVRGYILIGLVSYKVPRVANNVIIYTDVGYYHDWILYNVRRLYCTQIAI